ncbi:MAG: hypothetical protein KatS3mg058_1415 [Roseiflexus sp.]|nr:MAG: hypothetical protein KatS3mg058_1415 [Roseiflexus sp.]
MKPKLTLELLKTEAHTFAAIESGHREPTLYGVTDGKAVGTYFEHKFRSYLREKYDFKEGSSASGIDFPEIEVDMKVTSIRQPPRMPCNGDFSTVESLRRLVRL